jgi:protein-disulfide isomerase
MQLMMAKTNLNIKLFFLIKFFLIYFTFCSISFGEDINIKNSLITIGNDNAPIKIKVFSSLTCPHCADFHTKVVPKIKEKYIENGTVQLIFIDFPLDQFAFNASKLLYCLDKEKQKKFLDTLYENQNHWASGTDADQINNNLKNLVRNFGIDSSQFDKCLNNDIISDKILNGRIKGHEKYSINSTPTIIINEKKLEGSASFKNIQKKIEKLI